ncbi:MAG: hypothetical protein ABIW79_00675, partial [Gemmatimonas sp.]
MLLLSLGGLALCLPDRGATTAYAATARARCTLMPGKALLLLRVERDTLLPFGVGTTRALSFSGVAAGAYDSLLATPGTPMPGARVRLMRMDSATRAVFTDAGIADSQPTAFIRAAPYRADCRTIRLTDTTAWVRTGDVGFARATVAPRELWIDGVPLFVIPDSWNYPFPRQRGLAYGTDSSTPLASPQALFGIFSSLGSTRANPFGLFSASDTAALARAIAWTRDNLAEAER